MITITRVPVHTSWRRLTAKFAAASVAILAVYFLAWAEVPALAEAPKKKLQAKIEDVVPARPALLEQQLSGSIAAQYCEAVRDVAAEARLVKQMAHLEELGKKIDGKTSELEARSAQLKDWIQKREAFVKKATEQLVSIYTGMRAEAASEQIARLDPTTAASILMRLDTRVASSILNEMPSEKAANLSMIVAASAQTVEPAVNP
ncbi:MAG: MotE family protein [Hyphomicrobium aestuarii]|nr:MotE family protein [Hyphomicrobium aestuarii]